MKRNQPLPVCSFHDAVEQTAGEFYNLYPLFQKAVQVLEQFARGASLEPNWDQSQFQSQRDGPSICLLSATTLRAIRVSWLLLKTYVLPGGVVSL